VVVDLLPGQLAQQRDQLRAKGRPSDHELQIVAAAVSIGPVQSRPANPIVEPEKKALVADVHSQGDLRLLAVAAEMPVRHEEPEDEPFLEVGKEFRTFFLLHSCFTE
jgi:hypothetical protein